MKIIKEKITEFGELTGYLHEPSEEIRTPSGLPAILVLPGGGFRICSDREAEPAFLFSTATDTITPPVHPLTFAGALDRAGVGFELHIFREGDHGLSLAKPCTAGEDRKMMNVSVSQWFPLSIQWLKAELNL